MNAIKEELKLASEMLTDAELMLKEERLRSAVSRAYYSMFHATKAVLLSQGTDCRSHAGARSRLGEYIIKKGLMDDGFAKSLHRANRMREKSDYSPAFKIDEEDVEKLVKEAKDFLSAVKELLHV